MSDDERFEGQGFVAWKAGFCGCGEHEALDRWMLAYLDQRAQDHLLGPDIEGLDAKTVVLLAFLADKLGWTEHGTSMRFAWLTDEGVKARDLLRAEQAATA